MSSVDAAIGERQRQLLFSAAATGVMLCVLSLVFIWVVVDRPIRDLMRGTRKVSAGDLSYRLPERSSDELGDLARAFNRMTEALERANAELTEWGKTLERRVRSKTEELERAHSTLVAAEKMASLGRLAATVAHEVNNPLFGMLTYARLTMKAVNKAPLDEATREGVIENLRVIERESKRCGELMQNLLTFARQSPPQRAPVDVNVLVERAAGLVRHQMELQEIALELELDRALAPVSCDPSQIQQVLLVLLVNACEAMPEGGLVRVVTAGGPERGVVTIRVKDNGPGIPPETVSQIFEPFFTTKDNQHRTGLGLAIARNIIDRHAGSLEVFSEPGKGAEFVITLPLEAAESVPGPAGLVLETGKEG
jgi:two-component system NtrC family sensor kinase